MSQVHERRNSASPFIETVWQSTAVSDGVYLVTPDAAWDLITASKADGSRIVFLTGQITKPARMQYSKGERSVVISFTAGAYITYLKGALTNTFVMLPITDDGQHFLLAEHEFPIPTFEDAEEIVAEMVRLGVLQHDAIVEGVLQDKPKAASKRSVQRHFKAATGVTHKQLSDIQRAQTAVRLLRKGVDPSTAASEAGYYDQPHLTKSLKRLMDSSPTATDDVNQV